MENLSMVFVALIAGALRVSTPFLFVSLGECLTEKSGRINLGNEGALVLGAMTAYAFSYETGSPWLGVLAAMCAGGALGLLHGLVCSLARVNDIAMGIAVMLAGIGIAFFFGKPYIQPSAPQLPVLPLGFWSDTPQIRSALDVSPLFFLGLLIAVFMAWAFKNTRTGLVVRIVGDSADAARAMGLPIDRIRILSTVAGSALAGVGGSFLSLSYPGSWNEGLSSGQGLVAVALVVFARWNPIACVGAALLFGAAGALGPSLQTIGVTQGYYLFYAAPYVLTLVIMVLTVAPGRVLRGMPGELSLTR
ncbi:ABC transporter permease [Terrihabitans soli]|uniref:ABC transporter permease n=1 Tax=Terrihabitans soli TaxID=708113 RepID=A0A6S6QXR0_9HYPH|nr:ABC transporter permease [Terrihabitans soli]BCJ92315.1 ABC transporter permease [Terrihabitans soli]